MSDVPFELQLLKKSVRYQEWVSRAVQPFLGESILEVGAGIGNMSKWLPVRKKLVLSEADPSLLQELKSTVRETFTESSPVQVAAVDLSKDWTQDFAQENFDTIVSFNVLEHIEDDGKALEDLTGLLKRSSAKGTKRIVTFVPAHNWAYGSLDREFKHFRRYSSKRFEMLKTKVAPQGHLHCEYFNVFGLPGWLLMGRILRRKQIGLQSVQAFETICPYIQKVDRFLHRGLRMPLGQSLIAVLTL